jgi:hypothetical protein
VTLLSHKWRTQIRKSQLLSRTRVKNEQYLAFQLHQIAMFIKPIGEIQAHDSCVPTLSEASQPRFEQL